MIRRPTRSTRTTHSGPARRSSDRLREPARVAGGHAGCVRVALLAESFLPHMNGVTGSVLHVLRHLAAEGHETLVIAPRSGDVTADLHGARTELLRSVPLPSYPEVRSEEHTSELQSLMRISYAVFCLKKKTSHPQNQPHTSIQKT